MSTRAAALAALLLIEGDLRKIVSDNLSQEEVIDSIGQTIRRVEAQREMIGGGFHPAQSEGAA